MSRIQWYTLSKFILPFTFHLSLLQFHNLFPSPKINAKLCTAPTSTLKTILHISFFSLNCRIINIEQLSQFLFNVSEKVIGVCLIFKNKMYRERVFCGTHGPDMKIVKRFNGLFLTQELFLLFNVNIIGYCI